MSPVGKDRPDALVEKGTDTGSPTSRPGPAGGWAHRRPRERLYRRAIGIGLSLSALLHVALVLVVGSIRLAQRAESPLPTRPPTPEGLTVIRLLELLPPPGEAEPVSPQEQPTPPARVRPAAEAPARLPAAEAEPTEPLLTNAERLQPRLGDERLWVDFWHPIRPGSSRRDRYAEAVDRLRRIVRVWLDSLQLSEEQRRRALDWTVGEGADRWGISAEGLHLGEITIPIPFGSFLQQTGPLARQARQALRDLQEIQGQDVRQDVGAVMRERREEMRRRSEEEAERRKKDTTRRGT